MVSASSDSNRQTPTQDEINKRISPMLFEIGRSAPVRLNNPAKSEAEEGRGCGPRREDWLECTDWQPTRENRPTSTTILGFALAFIAGVSLAATLSNRFWRFLLGHWRILAGIVALTGAFAAWLIASLPSPLGEPFSWVEGVSVWPTEILRMLTLALSMLLFLSGTKRLRHSDESIHERFFLGTEQKVPRKHDERFAPEAQPVELDVPVKGIWRLYRARQFCVSDLTKRLADRHIEVVPSWLNRHFVLQNGKPTVIYLALGFALFLALGYPQTPTRGDAMFILDKIVLYTSVVSFLMLLFFTLNASRRAVWLAHNLSKRSSWPHATLSHFGWREGMDQKYFDDFLDVQLLAAATSGVQQLVYYPFAVFFLLVLSRTRLFDGWHIPLSLYLIFVVAGVLMLTTAVRLRRAAEESRSRALDRMNLHLLKIQGQSEMEAMEQQVKSMIALTKGIRLGAYSPIGEQPIVRAILGLASGIYAISFLEWLDMAGL